MGITDDRNGPDLHVVESSGMNKKYLVLSESERKRGFVRPVRRAYKHVGLARPTNPLRELTPEEHARYDQYGYVRYEEYPRDSERSALGRYWTQSTTAWVPCLNSQLIGGNE